MKMKFGLLIALAISFFLCSCAPSYKILKKDNSVVETKKISFTSKTTGETTTTTGVAYQPNNSSTWDTIKADSLGFIAQKDFVTCISPAGKIRSAEVDNLALDVNSVCMKAKIDAISGYYPTGIVVGDFIAGFCVGVVGVIPAAITASTPVSQTKVDACVSDTSLLKKQDYKPCLTEQAQKIKRDKSWSSWIRGWCTAIEIGLIIFTVSNIVATASSY
jgi:hypothetical protein